MLTDSEMFHLMTSGGVVTPSLVVDEARELGLPISIAIALLFKESGGGKNIFGHDLTIYSGAGEVTKAKYEAYLVLRNKTKKYQGVGPCQLTFGGYQDEADKLGGCWIPKWNMRVGFGVMAGNIRRDGLHAGIAAYNGEGPAAEAYASELIVLANEWSVKLHLPHVVPKVSH